MRHALVAWNAQPAAQGALPTLCAATAPDVQGAEYFGPDGRGEQRGYPQRVRASAAAQRGYKVIVPVDCMSSEDPYMEQYAAWHMFKGGPAIVTSQTTLTRSDMIKF